MVSRPICLRTTWWRCSPARHGPATCHAAPAVLDRARATTTTRHLWYTALAQLIALPATFVGSRSAFPMGRPANLVGATSPHHDCRLMAAHGSRIPGCQLHTS